MNRYKELVEEARDAQKNNQLQNAALLWEQSYQLAKQLGEAERAFKAGANAADNWLLCGHPWRALDLYVEVLQDVPPTIDLDSLWGAKQRVFEIFLLYNPQLKVLQRRLNELESMAQGFPDLQRRENQARALLFRVRGKYEDALFYFGSAWAKRNKADHSDRWIAYNVVIANLKLGRIDSARHWHELLGKTGKNKIGSIYFHKCSAYLALWEGQVTEAEQQAQLAEELAESLQWPQEQQRAIELRIRTLLLQSDFGDPATPHHPARHRLKQRMGGKKPQVFMIYDHRLLLVDYRLATLRYALGMSPVEDEWYRYPQTLPVSLPTRFNMPDFDRRVLKTRTALHHAMQYAIYLDNCLEYEWRQTEIRGREARLTEILQWITQTTGKDIYAKHHAT